MKQILLYTMLVAGLTGGGSILYAQAPGSATAYGGAIGSPAMSIANGGTTADAAESLYIGPGSYTIDGTWEIYSRNVWISPDAHISGAGTILLLNPSVAGGSAAATLVDGNGSSQAIEVNIQLQNAQGMQLTQLAVDPTLTGAGWTDVTTSSSLYTGKDLMLSTDGANITLGSSTQGDLLLDANATISSYSAARMVITGNSILSHMVKEDVGPAFVFPVGIASGDYTPATIASSTTQDIWVSVTNYTGSGTTITAPAEGMDRAWHIYGSAATAADVILQHNNSTDGAAYTDASAFISQYQGAGQWSSSTIPDFMSAGVHGKTGLAIPGAGADAGSWFTKASDAATPLPVTLLGFGAETAGCQVIIGWKSGSEHNFSHYELQHSTTGRYYSTIATIAATGSYSRYSYTDVTPAQGNNYYRLKLVEDEGTYSYSPVATVALNCGQAQLVLYPNPTYGIVIIEGLKGNEQVLVTDALGRTMKQAAANGATLLQVDLGGLASAAYQVVVTGNSEVRMFKVVKQQ